MRLRIPSALVDEARRLMDGVQRQGTARFVRNPNTEEPTAAGLWQEASPKLEKALAIYDRKESADTVQSSWIPGRTTKKSCQKDLDVILDTVLAVLETCGAAGYRQRIRKLHVDNSVSQTRLAGYREQMLSAPAKESQSFGEGLLASSKESLKDRIADETDRIAERNGQIESLTQGFREHLQHIGICVSPETVDSFLLPTEDNIVSMAAVISNISRITEQLQQLVDASKEAPAQTRRYYGVYVLLVFAVDGIQTRFVNDIDGRHLPNVADCERHAVQNIADAQAQLSHGGPHETLTANIAANRRTIEACRLMADTLRSRRRSVLDDNRIVRTLEAAAVNTYKTVCLSLNVAELVGYCEAAFHSLRELRLPQLRPFQNVQLNDELQRLAERVAAKQ